MTGFAWVLACALGFAPRTVDLVEQRVQLKVAGQGIEGSTTVVVVPLSPLNRSVSFRAEGIELTRVRAGGREVLVEKTARGFILQLPEAGEQSITIDYRAAPKRGLLVVGGGFFVPPRRTAIADWVPMIDVERDVARFMVSADVPVAAGTSVTADAWGHFPVVAGAYQPVKGPRVTAWVRAGQSQVPVDASNLVTAMERLTGVTLPGQLELVVMEDGTLNGAHPVAGGLVEEGAENLAHVVAHAWFGGLVHGDDALLEALANELAWMAAGGATTEKRAHAWHGAMGDAAFSALLHVLLTEHSDIDDGVVQRVREELGAAGRVGHPQLRISVEKTALGTVLHLRQGPQPAPLRTSVRVGTARSEMVLPVVMESGEASVSLPAFEWAILDEEAWVWPVPPMIDPEMTERALRSAALPRTRAAAARALRFSRLVTTEEALRAALKDPDAMVRADAVSSLQGDVSAMLGDADARVQEAAARASCRRGDARALGKLAGTGATMEVREAAGFALGCHEREAPDLVTRAMKLKSPGGRVEAAVLRGVATSKPDHPMLLAALQTGSAREIEAAAQGISPTTNRAQVVQVLVLRLNDAQPRVRLSAALALGRLHAVEARGPLENALRREPFDDVEDGMAGALAAMEK